MEGKIISYFHQSYKSYVFLGCILDNPRYTQPGVKAFDPDQVPLCANALGPNKDINILNLLAPEENVMTFRIRERVRTEQTKAMVVGEDPSTQKGSRRTKERKIGEVIQKVQKWRNLYYTTGESLEEAAKKVGISKKSLDDYFL